MITLNTFTLTCLLLTVTNMSICGVNQHIPTANLAVEGTPIQAPNAADPVQSVTEEASVEEDSDSQSDSTASSETSPPSQSPNGTLDTTQPPIPPQGGLFDPNCMIPDTSSGTCFRCRFGYTFDASNVCVPSLKNACFSPCKTCRQGQPTYCLTCHIGFTAVDSLPGQCFPAPGTLQPPIITPQTPCELGCATCRDQDRSYCLSCSPGFFEVNDPALRGRCLQL